jgi:hypothetical protein
MTTDVQSQTVLHLSKSTMRRHSAVGENGDEHSRVLFLGSESFTCSTFSCGGEVSGWCQCCGDTIWCKAPNQPN